ncbi:diacylglycerol/lipid kinase family protein [Pontibacillus litoralis]|uniref:DAGKc domain-containing protein n=1 Tax=Pontibacillus litoralis JSM 072002 TaxID=1385512 RepID=A0A0A5G7U8_9BACI|nr:diacylglycerol kinase family protein [Pontibacillus litoralis]KGX89216.1 hypothetical protein N784_02235 [Pontibacillus litoralis JSM 072002]
MYVIIINPTAGAGRGKKVYEKLQKHISSRTSDCRSFFTKYEGHAEELAPQIVSMHKDKVEAVLVIGGDGTMHEVLNGLKQHPHIPIGFIPAGSGNDFVRGIQSKARGSTLFKKLLSARKPQAYWAGVYRMDKRKKHHSRLFVNSIGFGFDAEVVKRANVAAYKKLFNSLHIGSFAYIVAVVEMLFRYELKTLDVEVDGEVQTFENVWMAAVGVHGYYGGGMKIMPDAKMNRNHFSMIIIHDVSKWKILALFGTVFFGVHKYFQGVTMKEGSCINIKSYTPISYQVDGQPSSCEQCMIHKESQPRKVLQIKK